MQTGQIVFPVTTSQTTFNVFMVFIGMKGRLKSDLLYSICLMALMKFDLLHHTVLQKNRKSSKAPRRQIWGCCLASQKVQTRLQLWVT